MPEGKAQVAFCNTGHNSALGWFVTSEILGRPGKLYDGSMAGWTRDPSLPMHRAVSED